MCQSPLSAFLLIPLVMHTWEGSLIDFAFLRVATGSADLVRVEGAIDACLSPSFSVEFFWSGQQLVGGVRSSTLMRGSLPLLALNLR